MGFYFSFVEGLVQLFLSQDERQEQANLFKYLKLGKMGEVFSLVQRRVPKQSMIRSWLFVLIYIVMGLFVMTSTRSFVGEGLVLGIGLRYLIDFWQYRKKYSQLIQIYGPIDDDILTKIPLIFSIIFVIFSLIGLQLL